jgi:hypothetical protein
MSAEGVSLPLNLITGSRALVSLLAPSFLLLEQAGRRSHIDYVVDQ